ncbi:lipopolysaccharide A protein [Vibrio parahaemolyticus]|uniref:glycosyl transferase family 90 n=1 Tax=Vibrio parahaemolyticus TaxID=670 RepID=UPI00193EF10C|nr:glycosyl transferase family 90 [Vibrio parahaemolyticus]EGQ8451120.1 lipopolysaccharide A protein [Vibrio parahaemolyticus]EID4381191.1 lipopolysaccharide A protein [Vibrio parahaemolyticus]EIU7001675.1 lipopolysaccharide A protein [Vibrio parahaemolyticus]EJE8512859.1 lipopolysaccharide A protein [Vibrio parahaemolyticus]EJE8772802.1 lipopolysaccharide A protein [Vibrio parahaemolyticus]
MKDSKFPYYFSNALSMLVPRFVYRAQAKRLLSTLTEAEKQCCLERVNYYNKCGQPFTVDSREQSYAKIGEFKKTKGWTYFFDTRQVIRYFPSEFKFNYINGDVTHIPNVPSFIKSRPIHGDNQNSVVLKLNQIRHFKFVDDEMSYHDKKDMVAWRGVGFQPHRQTVIHAFYDHPQCNIGQTRPQEGQPWEKGFMSIEEQLQYKFLLCIEGNDVATNLKWAMSSNSLVIMSKPKYETWFMEGKLEAGIHYVEVQDDYSDLPEKMDYYLANEQEALAIIENAHQWVEQFKDKRKERLISLMVADKYFTLSHQQ